MSRTEDLEAIGDRYRATGKIYKALSVYKKTGSKCKVASLLSMLAHNATNLSCKISLYEEALDYNPDLDKAKPRLKDAHLLLADRLKKKGKFVAAIWHYEQAADTQEIILKIADCYYSIAEKNNDIEYYKKAAVLYKMTYDNGIYNTILLTKLGKCYEALAIEYSDTPIESINLYTKALQFYMQDERIELLARKIHKILGDQYARLSDLEPGNFLHYEDAIQHYIHAGRNFCHAKAISAALKKYGDTLVQANTFYLDQATKYYELAQKYDPNIRAPHHVERAYGYVTVETQQKAPLVKPIPDSECHIPKFSLDTPFFEHSANIEAWLTGVYLEIYTTTISPNTN